jgi:hypothetical protein
MTTPDIIKVFHRKKNKSILNITESAGSTGATGSTGVNFQEEIVTSKTKKKLHETHAEDVEKDFLGSLEPT